MTNQQEQQLKDAIAQHPSFGKYKLAKVTGLNPSMIYKWQKANGLAGKAKSQERQITTEEDGAQLTITAKSLDIRTLEDLLANSDVDLNIWDVERFVCNSWEVTNAEGQCYTNYQVKAWFRPKVEAIAKDALFEIAKGLKPRKLIVPKFDTGPLLFVPTQFDTHFGKLTWGEETGTDYDIKIAEDLWDKATAFCIEKALKIGGIGKIILPVGSDLFHINNNDNETAKGTKQDVDGRLAKIYRTAYKAVIRQIDALAQLGPIEVLPVKGNHDPQLMLALMELLAAWYRNCDHVTVSTSLRIRNARMFGDCFIGFDHGDTVAANNLGTVFSTEFPEMWGRAKYRIIFIGHWHKKKETRYLSADTYGNYIVHVCPSLSGTDAWHYEKGFIGDRITENHIFTTSGKLSTFEITASQLLALKP